MSISDIPDFVTATTRIMKATGGDISISSYHDYPNLTWSGGSVEVYEFTIDTPTLPTGLNADRYAVQVSVEVSSSNGAGDCDIYVDGGLIGHVENCPTSAAWFDSAGDVTSSGSHTVRIEIFNVTGETTSLWEVYAYCGVGTSQGSYTLVCRCGYPGEARIFLTFGGRCREADVTVYGEIRADDSTIDSASGSVAVTADGSLYEATVEHSTTCIDAAYMYAYTSDTDTACFITHASQKALLGFVI